MRSFISSLILALSASAAPAAVINAPAEPPSAAVAPMVVPAAIAKIPLDENFVGSIFQWQGGGETTIIFSARAINGKIAVCGGYVHEGSQVPKIVISGLLRSRYIRSRGGTVMTNLGFLTNLTKLGKGADAEVTCRVSRRKWSDKYGADLELRSNSNMFEY